MKLSPFLILTAFSFLVNRGFSQELPATANRAFVITRMADLYHIQPRPVDRMFSSDLFSLMIDAIDGDKIYFTAEDIRQLEDWRYRLDQELLNKKQDFLKLVIGIFSQRIRQTEMLIDSFSRVPVPPKSSEVYTVTEDSAFAGNAALRRTKLRKLFWRNALETIADAYDDMDSAYLAKAKPAVIEDSLERVARKKTAHIFKRDIQHILQTNGGIEGFVCNAWCESVASCYDPHTEFFSASKKEEFEGELGEKQMQFGFSLSDGKDGPEIARLKPGSPAYKSGQIHEGDAILAIQWEGYPEVDVSDASPEEVSALLAGDHPKNLTLTLRKSDGSVRKITLQKEEAVLDDDEGKVRSFILKGDHRIGFVSLPAFYTDWEANADENNGCADDVAKEILKLKQENIEGLILDLRYNGGGSITEAIALTGIFIDAGPVGMARNKEGKIFTMKDVNRGAVYDGPLLLLVNGFSASASEMVAGSLQDYHRALIVGSPTFGKATAQVVVPLDTTFNEDQADKTKTYDDYLKVTVERLYRVTGNSAQETGVVPDVPLRDYTDTRAERERTLPHALPNTRIDPNKYYHPYPPLPVDSLQAFAKRFSDSSAYISAYNHYLDQLVEMQKPGDETLSLDKVRAQQDLMNRFLASRGEFAKRLPLPYEIQWTEFEKIRMRTDEDLRNTNQLLTDVLIKDPGLLLGYRLVCSMIRP